ncbi:MAG: hypothetical protein HOO06_10050 [Bdellovibrionaceae bacterium]|jgi:hypothetical protein|nr:hypothetical protein [Pseudobdellovibrionaceae bacterium]
MKRIKNINKNLVLKVIGSLYFIVSYNFTLSLDLNENSSSVLQEKVTQDGLRAYYIFGSTNGNHSLSGNDTIIPNLVGDLGLTLPEGSNVTNPALLNITVPYLHTLNGQHDIDGDGTNEEYYRRSEITGDFIKFFKTSTQGPIAIKSGDASELASECSANGALSLELWLVNNDHRPSVVGLSKIVSLTRNYDELGPDNNLDAVGNFYFGTRYDQFALYEAGYRTGADIGDFSVKQTSVSTDFSPQVDEPTARVQHVFLTVDANRTEKIYVSDGATGELVRMTGSLSSHNGNFLNWDKSIEMVLSLTNEISKDDAADTALPNVDGATQEESIKNKAWSGSLYSMAIYCGALSESEILGPRAPNPSAKFSGYDGISSVSRDTITPARLKAARLHSRLTGVKIPIDHPSLDVMETEVAKGTALGMKAAAQEATKHPDFYNITVKDFATRMSNRDETVNDNLNDFIATVIGVTADHALDVDDIDGANPGIKQSDARTLLFGNFVYRADPTKSAVPAEPVDYLASNRHYEELEKKRYNIGSSLVREPQSVFVAGAKQNVNRRNAAGLITSRAFMSAHASAGTNRRIVEYTFRQFLCIPIEKWADPLAGDDVIGRDVERSPGGSHQKFKTSCRACHSVMDGFRGSTAYFDFPDPPNSFVVITDEMPAQAATETTAGQNLVVQKMNRNSNVFPAIGLTGDARFQVKNDARFVNNAIYGANASYFKWEDSIYPNGDKTAGVPSGSGIRSFGKMVSQSGAFAPCMAKRVYRSVCKREPASFDQPMLDSVANKFSTTGFKLKDLFEDIALSPECLGRD